MLVGYIEGATRVIGKSQGYEGLPVRDELFNSAITGPDTPQMTTAWQPSAEELSALNAGASIRVILVGVNHPPIRLEVGPVPRIIHGGG